jgi:hypothetical protein
MDVTPLGNVLGLGEGRWCWRSMGKPPKATCQASKHSHHGEDPLLLKTSMCQMSGTSPPSPSPPHMTSSSKRGHFAPHGKIVWKVRVGLCRPSHHQGLPSLIFLIWHAGPWHPTCGLVAPWKPKLGLFSQNYPPTRSCKDK